MVLAAHASDTEVCCLEKQCADRKNSTSLQCDSLGTLRSFQTLLKTCFYSSLRARCSAHDVITLDDRRHTLAGASVFDTWFDSYNLP